MNKKHNAFLITSILIILLAVLCSCGSIDNNRIQIDQTLPSTAQMTATTEEGTSEDTTAASTQPTTENSKEKKAETTTAAEKSVEKSGSTGKSETKSVNNSEKATASAKSRTKDKYLTDPIPEGKPEPVEPQEQETENSTTTCTFSISCASILDNMSKLDPEKVELVPEDGWILKPTIVEINEGESVFDVLIRVCKENKIHTEYSWTPIYNSSYIEGIANLYEFDCGSNSGWMYSVNGWYPNYGCSRYVLQKGDTVEWRYTCNLGHDIGGGYVGQGAAE